MNHLSLSLSDQIILAKIITVFDKINGICTSAGGTVMLFSSSQECIEFYEEQMMNIEYEQHEIDLFINWLRSL